MDILLQQYYETLSVLQNLLDREYQKSFSLRDHQRVDMLCDEIQDVQYSIRGMERILDDKCGYRPRRVTLLASADLPIATCKDG